MSGLTQAGAVVMAALFALFGVIASLVTSTITNRRDSRIRQRTEVQQRQFEVLSTAMTYLDGGSQRRAVGLAMLEVIWDDDVRKKYEESITRLLITQLNYLLVHGRNRWEGHELANMTTIVKKLAADNEWLQRDLNRGRSLQADIDCFLRDSTEFESWELRKSRSDGGVPNKASLREFRDQLKRLSGPLIAAGT